MRAPDAPVTPVIVRSIEPVNLPEFLRRYARAIVEAYGTGPSSTVPQVPSTPAA